MLLLAKLSWDEYSRARPADRDKRYRKRREASEASSVDASATISSAAVAPQRHVVVNFGRDTVIFRLHNVRRLVAQGGRPGLLGPAPPTDSALRRFLGVSMLSGWIRYALLLGVVLSVSAQATDLAVNSFSFSNGAEFPGARGSLQISAAPTGDSIQALHYDFSKGGHYVQSILSLGTPVTASYLRFRINAPLAAPLSLRVVDATGQVLQFGLNRGTSATDELGWSELSVNITSSSGHYGGANDGNLHGAISQIDFIINASSASLTGTAYIRAVELLSGAPST
ncbi:MAG: hypothetical protein ACRET0_10810, partial [Steroidobacteraceae bacterium]